MDDVQSWWEIPCIAHFCSLFRTRFDLLDFDIEELEEALLTDSVEEVGSSLVQDLIVGLLKGCFNKHKDEITTCNYQMYLRRLFRRKCEEGSRKVNPFDKDPAFHSLPLKKKVEIIYDLCDFRLDNKDASNALKSLEADSVRVKPLGRDSCRITYWYFYGTRLYSEYEGSGPKVLFGKKSGRKSKEVKNWKVACFTEEDWQLLTRKYKNSKSNTEKKLYRELRETFLPELPRLFAEKERLQRKRMMDQQLRRSARSTVTASETSKEEMANPSGSKKSSSNSGDDDRSVKEDHDGDSEMMDEDEERRKREEQEKADRLLAEEIEREDRRSRLHLRERRGGGSGGGFSGSGSLNSSADKSSNQNKSNKQRAGSASGSRSSSNNKSPSKSVPPKSSPVKGKDKKKKKKKVSGGRMTNNSLAASLLSGAASKSGDESDQDDDIGSENCDDGAKKKSSKSKKNKEETEQSRSRSRSRSPSPKPPVSSTSPSKKHKKVLGSSLKIKKKKSSGHVDSDKTKDKSKKKRKIKHKDRSKEKEKEKGKTKDKEKSSKTKEKLVAETNHVMPINTVHSTGGMSKTKVKSSIIFSQTEEDVQIGMHKVIESVKNHAEAWPFLNPVDEDYAPNYYKVISSPMDLQMMEDKLDNQEYCSLDEFIADFQRIFDNCMKYNGPSSEYTEMVTTLQEHFNRSINKFIPQDESDDEEISIEYSNAEVERKRPRLHNHNKKEEKEPELKKDIDPNNCKKATPLIRSQCNKNDKKKLKQKLMRHHSRNSEAIENLAAAGAETIKDMDKMLGDREDPVKNSEYLPPSKVSDNVKTRIPDEEKVDDVVSKKKSSIAGHKRKKSTNHHVSSRSSPQKFNDSRTKVDDDDDDEFTPPKKMFKKSEKHGKGDRSKGKSDRKSGDSSSKKSEKSSKDRDKGKHHHRHHKHHKHHHNSSTSSSGSKRDSSSSPKLNHKLHGAKDKVKEEKPREHQRETDAHQTHMKDHSHEKHSLKHSKSVEEKKPKSAIKRANSLLNSLKNSGTIKRLQQNNNNKTTKFNSYNAESKFKPVTGDSFGSVKGVSGEFFPPGQTTGRDASVTNEKPEKKKCLLLNNNTTNQKGGPRLSLGSVLSTDAIKLGECVKDEVFSDDDYEASISTNTPKVQDKTEPGETEEQRIKDTDEQVVETKPNVEKDVKETEIEAEKEEEQETDRKLEPSKGFNREKCMPNLSAWIKAFGGPAKAVAGLGTGLSQIKKPDTESKNKFKVMGRGVGESNTPVVISESVQKPVPKGSPVHKSSGKPVSDPPWTSINHSPAQSPLAAPIKAVEQTQVINLSEENQSTDVHHRNNKKHRHRKISTSSMSSQSESGSPHCFNNQEGSSSGVGSVVNPPRWVDEHWTQSHSQSQSPSASSQVSSQSPANSPFSPAINSPPHTPQTPPRSVGPVRVGFYQDITSQHSSPEKLNEPHSNSNSNVASPSTPPTPTNSTNSSRRAESGNNVGSNKAGYGNYPTPSPVYAPRYAASTPSPNVGPGSNVQSPSPGGIGSVESPGNPNSPHSPSMNSGGGNSIQSVPEYRTPSYTQASQIQNAPVAHLPVQSTPPAHQQPSTAHRASSSILSSHGGHTHAPSIAPYPPPVSHYGHPSVINQPHPETGHAGQQPAQAHQPAIAHINQVQAHSQMSHQQHYERYPPIAHHQINPQSSMPPSSSAPISSAASSYTQNMTAAHSQRPSTVHSSPYPTSPYTSNPRNINIPPNVYNNPLSSDSTITRFYKPTGSSGELSLTAGLSSNAAGLSDTPTSAAASSGSHSRGRSSRSHASSAQDIDIPRTTAAALEGKLSHNDLNGFQWPHNLASLSQIVNSIPNPMNAAVVANAYRQQYDQAMAESMSKFQRTDPTGYTSLSASSASNMTMGSTKSGSVIHPPAAHSHSHTHSHSHSHSHSQSSEKSSDSNAEVTTGSNSRRQSKSESKSSRSQGGNSKGSAQSIVPGSAFNFSTLTPADLALYPKDMSDPSSLYSASPPSLAHRPDLYPTSSSNFHPSFSTTVRTTAGGTPTITPYQIPPFIGSHPSPYQPQSVSSQPFAHSQPPRGLTVDPYQQFFPASPHVMGLLPPAGYTYPHGLGFNRPSWI